MALRRNIFGFEPGLNYDISGPTDAFIIDGTAATGCYYGRTLIRSGTGTPTSGTAFLHVFESISPNLNVIQKARMFFRFRIKESVNRNQTHIASFPAGTFQSAAVILLNSDNTWSLQAAGKNSAGTNTLPTSQWIECEIEYDVSRPHTGVQWDAIVNAKLNGFTTGVTQFNLALGNWDRFSLGSAPAFNTGTGLGDCTEGTIEFDDITAIFGSESDVSSVVLPSSNRIRLIPIVAQGAANDWTGDPNDLKEVPFNPAGAGVTSDTAGQETTYTIPPEMTPGTPSLGIRDAEVVKLYGYLKNTSGSGASDEALLLAGDEYPVSVEHDNVPTGSGGAGNIPLAIRWGSIDLAGVEIGAKNLSGRDLDLGALHAEVLCEMELAGEPGCSLVNVSLNPHSGLYTVVPGKKFDTLYNWATEETNDVKIPNPKIKTGLLP